MLKHLGVVLAVLVASLVGPASACIDLPALRSYVFKETWTLPYLSLAAIDYIDESDAFIGNAPADIKKGIETYLPKLPCPITSTGKTIPKQTAKVPGKWLLEWGPAISRDNANLIYAASYRLFTNITNVPFNASSPTFPPVFLAFAVRGTDSETNGTGLLVQLLEDFQPFTTVDWNTNIASKNPLGIKCPLPSLNQTSGTANHSLPSANPVLAWGSCIGLKALITLTSRPAYMAGGPMNALSFLNAFIKSWGAKVPVVVTGHSLGATSATTVSMYLQTRVNAPKQVKVGAFPFAPSTAGNAAFAALFNSTIGSRSNLYMNTIDLVPHGYQYIIATLGLYFLYGGPLPPSYLIPLIPIVYEGVKDIGYTHPSPHHWMRGRYNPNTNSTYPAPTQWTSELTWQHLPPQYFGMLCYYFGKVAGGGTVRTTMLDYPLGELFGRGLEQNALMARLFDLAIN